MDNDCVQTSQNTVRQKLLFEMPSKNLQNMLINLGDPYNEHGNHGLKCSASEVIDIKVDMVFFQSHVMLIIMSLPPRSNFRRNRLHRRRVGHGKEASRSEPVGKSVLHPTK